MVAQRSLKPATVASGLPHQAGHIIHAAKPRHQLKIKLHSLFGIVINLLILNGDKVVPRLTKEVYDIMYLYIINHQEGAISGRMHLHSFQQDALELTLCEKRLALI